MINPFSFVLFSSQVGNSCSNRYSITSFKTSKLFYDTDRVPEYDVLSINAPENNQTVTFYFDQKVAWNETYDSSWQSNISSNAISNTSLADSFYDQLDSMIPQGTCMYLNTSAMVWQTDGCYTDREKSTSTSVTCTCEHLTMFTVFFSLTCATPSKTLYILSWIGCALSLIGLVCALILLMILSRCRQKKADEPTSSSSSAGWQHSMTVNDSIHLTKQESIRTIHSILERVTSIIDSKTDAVSVVQSVDYHEYFDLYLNIH